MAQRKLSSDEVLNKMAKYCAYQERCEKDVLDKLNTFELSDFDRYDIFKYLCIENFVSNERFAKSFVKGKINQSGWGLNKIRFHLMRKGIDKAIIDEALEGANPQLYRQRLIEILKTKAKTVKAESEYEKNRKLAAFAAQRGFESALVWEVLNGDFVD